MSKRIGVLGLGNWGTALAQHLARNGNHVIGWAREAEIVESISKKNRNSFCFPDLELSSNFKATSNLNEALNSEIVLIVFASLALKEMAPLIKVKDGTVLVSAIKGLEEESLLTPIEYIATKVTAKAYFASLSGPSFAKDVVIDKPCSVVAACRDHATAKMLAELFSNGRFRVYTSSDVLGVELGGALKNVIALAAGVCDGLGLGDSARTALITRGLAEITRLAVAMGAQAQTLSGLTGLGDLIMTATSALSRNRTVGFRLGQGEKLSDIITSLGSVAEGVKTAPLVHKLSKKYKVEMPISEHVIMLLDEKYTAKEMVNIILSRPLKKEFE